jgi:hypothetical protein
MFGSFLPSLWSSDNQVYSGRGADSVMQSSAQKQLSLLKIRCAGEGSFVGEFCLRVLIPFQILVCRKPLLVSEMLRPYGVLAIAFDPGGAPTSSDFVPWLPGGIAQRRSTVVAIELGAA